MDKAYAYPTITNASNYTSLKKNRILYNQYMNKYPSYVVCNSNKADAKYSSYDLRLQVKNGCWFNQKICLKKCSNILY